jgi:hypothetical protein
VKNTLKPTLRLIMIGLIFLCAMFGVRTATVKIAEANHSTTDATNNPAELANSQIIPQPNKPPLLTYESPQAVLLNDTLIVRPKLGLTDNGTVANLAVGVTPSEFTGTVTVSPDGVMTIADAGAVGVYTVTVSATDNEGATTLARFSLHVTSAPCLNYQFALGAPFPVSEHTRFLATGDFNEDGNEDIARSNIAFSNNPDDIEIFLGNGNGGFTSIGQIPGAGTPWSIDICDFNRDNHLDMVLQNEGGGFSILLGDGNGGFSHHFQSPFTLPVFAATSDVEIADFNGDGRVDIVVGTNSLPVQMYIYLNHPTLGLVEANISPINFSSYYPSVIKSGDFNKDGNADIVVFQNVDGLGTDSLKVFFGDGNGGFNSNSLSFIDLGNNLRVNLLAVTDWNNDGYSDVLVFGDVDDAQHQSVSLAYIFLGNHANTLTPTPSTPFITQSSSSQAITSLVIADFNLDGKKDILHSRAYTVGIFIFQGDGVGGFTPLPYATLPFAIGTEYASAVGDFNGDGRPDIAAGGGADNPTMTIDLAGRCGPHITPVAPLTRVRNGVGTFSHIATVGDNNYSAANLAVVAQTVPAGITVNSIANLNGQIAAQIAAAPGATLGAHTIVLKVTNPAGAFSTGDLIVNVTDSGGAPNPPIIYCPPEITISTDPNQCSAVVNLNLYVTASDGNGGNLIPVCVPPSGSTFPKGTTTVMCSATNAAGLTTSCSFPFTVNDTQQPSITCPANITQTLPANQCLATVNYALPLATDNCPGITVICQPPAGGALFTVGTTPVLCVATDARGLQYSCEFTVTITDLTPPVIQCPANISTSTASAQCSAVVNYPLPTVTDCSAVTAPNCNPPSGSVFQRGTTSITCTVSDASGNQGSCSFSVTVNDTQAPTITCPSNITATTGKGACAATVQFDTPTTTDNCSDIVNVVCNPPSGASFAKGTTTVTCTATDSSNNTATCSFTMTLNDTTPPVITCPANLLTNTSQGSCSAAVSFTSPVVSDNCGNASVACNPPSGSTFNKGVTTVNCLATDSSNNTATCSFTITVNDNQAPMMVCPTNLIVPTAAALCSATVAYSVPIATDNCPGVGTPVCNPPSGSPFPKGITTVTCVVSDASSISATCSFLVVVIDTQSPVLTCPPNQAKVAASPGAASAIVSYPAPVVNDNCPGASVVCVPPSGSSFPVGTTTVTCIATDAGGNTATCNFTVTVYDGCLQDDSNPATVLIFSTTTGQYIFCCAGTTYTGQGTVMQQGSVYTLTHNSPNRRVLAQLDNSIKKGTASLQSPPGSLKCTITDRDIRNNTCTCQ